MSDTTPHDADAELATLGSVMLDADTALPVLERAGIGAKHFYDLRHRRVFEACLALRAEGKPVCLPSLLPLVKDRSATDWRSLLLAAESSSPSAHAATFYVERLVDAHQRRVVLDVSRRLAISRGLA